MQQIFIRDPTLAVPRCSAAVGMNAVARRGAAAGIVG